MLLFLVTVGIPLRPSYGIGIIDYLFSELLGVATHKQEPCHSDNGKAGDYPIILVKVHLIISFFIASTISS